MDKSRKTIVPLPEPVRNFGARGISALVAPIIRPSLKRRAPAAYQLLADWDELAGPEVSAMARPVKLAGGTLTLGCYGPAAMEIQYNGEALIKRLNTGLGAKTVERLKFIQESTPIEILPRTQKATAAFARPPEGLPDGPLGAALTKLYQGITGWSE
jgi:hypothetical protein